MCPPAAVGSCSGGGARPGDLAAGVAAEQGREPAAGVAERGQVDAGIDAHAVQHIRHVLAGNVAGRTFCIRAAAGRSEEHTSELQSLMRISYAVFCLKKKTTTYTTIIHHTSIRQTYNNNSETVDTTT